MRILIVTLGSRGDVQPFVALGKGLKAAGHEVTVCTAERFEPLIVEHGLIYGMMRDEVLALMDSQTGRELMEDVTNLWKVIEAFRRLAGAVAPAQRILFEDGFRIAHQVRPDVILFHPKAYAAAYFAEKLEVPAILASPLPPQYVPSGQQPAFGFPALRLGAWYNRFTYRIVTRGMTAYVRKYVDAFRAGQELPNARGHDFVHAADGRHLPVMHAYSPHVAGVPADWPDDVVATGFWFLDEERPSAPDPTLSHFLETGDPPVYVGFGSMAGREPQRLTRAVIEALQLAEVRGVIATGWGGLTEEKLPPSILTIAEASHDWLFPRTAAVVHHGGIGTTAAGLRAGRPTLICPFFGDQPLWGKRVHALGVGPAPIPQKQLTPAKLAQAIRQLVSDDSMRLQAARLGEQIRGEDGVGSAVAFVERTVRPATEAQA